MPEAFLSAYRQLDPQSQRSVLDYIDFLLSKIKPAAKKDAVPHRYEKFLALAGKIDIDENAVRDLRERSRI